MNVRNIKNRDITTCGECKKYFNSDKLILDEKNKRYLCDGCFEPRDHDPEPEREPCDDCGKLDCECDKDDIEDNGDDIDDDKEMSEPVRTKRGEARINREQMSGRVQMERARPLRQKEKLFKLW